MKTTYIIEKHANGEYKAIHANNTLGRISLEEICSEERENRLLEHAIEEQKKYEEPTGILLCGVGSTRILRELEKRNIMGVAIDREGITTELGIESTNTVYISTSREEQDCIADIMRWQIKHCGMALIPILHPFHRKVADDSVYKNIFTAFKANAVHNIWKEMASSPRFIPEKTRKVLIVPQMDCLVTNIENAFKELGVETRSIALAINKEKQAGYALFLQLCVEFKPDFIFTLNHVGLEEGSDAILNVAEAMNIPIASWFVDSPDLLIGYEQKVPSNRIQVFSWEKSRVSQLESYGFTNVQYLPLGTDITIFSPKKKHAILKQLQEYKSPIAFIGGIAGNNTETSLLANIFPYPLLCSVNALYEEYLEYTNSSIALFLASKNNTYYEQLPPKYKREFAIYLFFYMNARYRIETMRALLPLSPTIIGEKEWECYFPVTSGVRVLPSVQYVTELPSVYQSIDVNLNITSIQMKTAVNQRVFDCPACGSFVLTDMQEELEALFDIGTEVAVYRCEEECIELAQFFMNHEKERIKIIKKAHRRILVEHTCIHRMRSLLAIMEERFG